MRGPAPSSPATADRLDVGALGPRADLAAVAALERRVFPRPWTEAMLGAALTQVTSLSLGARDRAVLRGYLVAQLIAGELHIHTVAVDPSWRRRGIGRRLVETALAEAVGRGAGSATLEVRRANRAARRLYERLGFVRDGIRRGYYRDPPDDALIYWRRWSC